MISNYFLMKMKISEKDYKLIINKMNRKNKNCYLNF